LHFGSLLSPDLPSHLQEGLGKVKRSPGRIDGHLIAEELGFLPPPAEQ
jgi:hypothetical protein